MEEIPHAWSPRQFENPANPKAHETTTGPEIRQALQANVDILVSGVGTGGTLTGCTRYLRQFNPDLEAVAVEPKESAVISGGRAGVHKIQGIGAGFIPRNLDTSLLNSVETVASE
jgi:cysteine synthase A